MLRHMYLLPYSQPNVKDGSNVFKFHINVFMLADKYDCPSLRNAVVAEFRRSANVFHKYWQIQDTLDNLISAIAELCGPDAQQVAYLSSQRSLVVLRREIWQNLHQCGVPEESP